MVGSSREPRSRIPSSRIPALVHELLGCLEGLKMAATMGMMHIVLETDAANVKIALESDEFRQSPMGGVITESSNILWLWSLLCVKLVCVPVIVTNLLMNLLFDRV